MGSYSDLVQVAWKINCPDAERSAKKASLRTSRPAASSGASGPTGKGTTLQPENSATIHAINDSKLHEQRRLLLRLWFGRIWKPMPNFLTLRPCPPCPFCRRRAVELRGRAVAKGSLPRRASGEDLRLTAWACGLLKVMLRQNTQPRGHRKVWP